MYEFYSSIDTDEQRGFESAASRQAFVAVMIDIDAPTLLLVPEHRRDVRDEVEVR